MNGKKICVLGAGAIGSSLSADFTDAGLDITVVDQWPAQVEKIRTDGLRVRMPDREVATPPLKALHLCELSSARLEFDIVFLAVKSNDVRWLSELIKPYLKSNGVLVPVQNGFNDDVIAGIVGRERVIGCALELSAEIFTPGEVKRNTTRKTTWFGVGELDGLYSPRLKEIESLLSHVGKVEATGNIYSTRWTKLVANTMTMGPFGLLGMGNKDAAALPGMFELSIALGKESLAVGTALGYRMEPIFGLRADEMVGPGEEILIKAMNTLLGHITQGRTAPIHDHMKGRTSEMEFIPGAVSKRGRELGIPTPFNDAIVEIDRRINRGELAMGADNFRLLQEKVGMKPRA